MTGGPFKPAFGLSGNVEILSSDRSRSPQERRVLATARDAADRVRVDEKKTGMSRRKTLSISRTAPLKPKPGLNEPLVRSFVPQTLDALRALLLHLRVPVQDDRKRCGGRLQASVDKEFLPVLTDLIRELLGGCQHFTRIGLEKHHRRSRVEIGTGLHRNRHHFAVGGEVKEFLTVASPFGLRAACVRDLPLSRALQEKRLHKSPIVHSHWKSMRPTCHRGRTGRPLEWNSL